jgi:hypothetical protein
LISLPPPNSSTNHHRWYSLPRCHLARVYIGANTGVMAFDGQSLSRPSFGCWINGGLAYILLLEL